MTRIDSSAGCERNGNSASVGGSFESVRAAPLFVEGESSVVPVPLWLNGIRQGAALSGEQAVDLQRRIDELRGDLPGKSEERFGGAAPPGTAEMQRGLHSPAGPLWLVPGRASQPATLLGPAGPEADPGDETGLSSRSRAVPPMAEGRRVRDLVAATGHRDISVHSRRARMRAERGL